MKRNVITIDEGKCIGCGLCASACHQGAIGLVNGKAKLLREDYCDGLGRCLPVCPTEAISFEERDIKPIAVKPDMEHKQQDTLACGCPGTNSKIIKRESTPEKTQGKTLSAESHLKQWPVQIKLVPVSAPYFDNAHLLIAADCAAYAYGSFHSEYMRNKITIIGCPKLDDGDYAEKLTAILLQNHIKSVTVVRMEVPCCSGIESAAKAALQSCGKMIPWQVATISTDGKIIEN
ncbi:MAG: 4Fe-4S binding protein [Defluviitaleaceae bacterium]|nr:4Fe-4S binding protein [Defluviitaleaceae bacterium]